MQGSILSLSPPSLPSLFLSFPLSPLTSISLSFFFPSPYYSSLREKEEERESGGYSEASK
jgi:hypothetical protein